MADIGKVAGAAEPAAAGNVEGVAGRGRHIDADFSGAGQDVDVGVVPAGG